MSNLTTTTRRSAVTLFSVGTGLTNECNLRYAQCYRLDTVVERLETEGFAAPTCGQSTVRVAPDGRVLPCTYWPESALIIDDVEARGAAIVEAAEFARDLDAPDLYCPFTRGGRMPSDWEATPARDLPNLDSACTTVVSAC